MNETAHLLAQSARRLLEHHPEAISTAGAAPGDASALLAALHESGLSQALVPANAGGAGCSWSEAAALPRQWGRVGAPLPLIEILMAERLIALADLADLSGRVTMAAPVGLKLTPQGPSAASAIDAAWHDALDWVVAPATDLTGATFILAIPAKAGRKSRDLAGEPRIVIEPDALAHTRSRIADGSALPSEEDIIGQGTSLLVAAMVGAMEAILDIAVEHARTRRQFGKTLGRFQAIQHMVAEIAGEVTASAAALDSALEDLEIGHASLSWRAAKVQAARGATVVASHAHQILGAIGVTDEHVLGRFTTRLWWWRDAWSRQTDCEADLGRILAAAGGGRMWPLLVDRHGRGS